MSPLLRRTACGMNYFDRLQGRTGYVAATIGSYNSDPDPIRSKQIHDTLHVVARVDEYIVYSSN